jgi:DNA-binding FadR family transcriptional regulator
VSATPSARRSGLSVADTIVRELEAAIAQDHLPTGHRIGTKAELQVRFGVAPATLAEALRVLRTRGVIDVRPGPGGGVFVADQAPLSRLAQQVLALRQGGATVNDVLAVLDGLDGAVIRDAAAHRRARDLQDLDRIARRLELVWADPVEGMIVNWQLHRRIAEISPNAVLRAFYLNLVDYLQDEPRDPGFAAVGYDAHSRRRLRLHLDIVEAIRSADERSVDDVIRRHANDGG